MFYRQSKYTGTDVTWGANHTYRLPTITFTAIPWFTAYYTYLQPRFWYFSGLITYIQSITAADRIPWPAEYEKEASFLIRCWWHQSVP